MSSINIFIFIQDVPLFAGIYSDLFPGVDILQPDRSELLRCINKELEKRNLQPTDWYLEKIIQVPFRSI